MCHRRRHRARHRTIAASGVEVFGADHSINDTRPPSLLVALGPPQPARYSSGTRPSDRAVAGDASGIKKLAVFADDELEPIGVLDLRAGRQPLRLDDAAPCQNVSETKFRSTQRRLLTASTRFVVKAFDAAGNEKASSTHYITVKNEPPADANAHSDRPGHRRWGSRDWWWQSWWRWLPNGVPTDGGSPPPAPVAQNPPTLKVTFDRNGRSALKAQYGRMVTVRGQLRDGRVESSRTRRSTTACCRRRPGRGCRASGRSGRIRTACSCSRSRRSSGRASCGSPTARRSAVPVAATAQAQLDVVAPMTFKVGPKRRAQQARGRVQRAGSSRARCRARASS